MDASRRLEEPRFPGRRGAFLQTVIWSLVLTGLLFAADTAMANPKYASVVMDGHTGDIVYSRHADKQRYPASLTKIMTLYMLFDAMEDGKVNRSTRMKVSRRAAGQPPSKLGLKAGQTIRVEDAIRALVTKSANDVAVVVAEHLGGTEAGFARKMTEKARSLGMSRTRFMNASGLPNSKQLTTARDMARLATRMRADFPAFYAYFGTREFRWNGRRYTNHNKLLGRYKGTTGLKTGYTRASGYNLTATVERDGRYLIGVVMGGKTAKRRDDHMVAILDRAYPKASRNGTRMRLATAVMPPLPNPRRTVREPVAQIVATALPMSRPAGDIDAPDAATNAPSALKAALSDAADWFIAPATAAETPADHALDEIRDSWMIQIGAYSDPEAAVTQIRRALDVAPSSLRGSVPVTSEIESNTKTLYRSRFAGLDAGNATAACGKLVRYELACITIPPSTWRAPVVEDLRP